MKLNGILFYEMVLLEYIKLKLGTMEYTGALIFNVGWKLKHLLGL